MTLARYQGFVQNNNGDIVPGASVEVISEGPGNPPAILYTDRAGTILAGNPVQSDPEGYYGFHVLGGAYRIHAYKGSFSREYRYVGIGLAQESDTLPAGYKGTSLTSMLISIASKTFTTQSGLAFNPGDYVRVAPNGSPTDFMEGNVITYVGDQMTVSVSSANGSGTYSDWTIGLAGPRGTNGIDGASALMIVRAVAINNVNLATLQNGSIVNGVTLVTNDTVLLSNQTLPANNGPYTVPVTGPATRHTSFATYNSMPGVYFSVMEGTAPYADSLWRCTSDRGGTIGVTALTFLPGGAGRIKLTAALNLYLSPAGSDTTGDGSITNPWRSTQKAYDVLMADYDLAGRPVVINMADGTYPKGMLAFGKCVGQTSFHDVHFKGNEANPAAVIVQKAGPPPVDYYNFAAAFGAQIKITGMQVEQGPTGAQDLIQAASQSVVGIGQIIFGDSINEWTDLIAYDGGIVYVVGDYAITKSLVLPSGDTTSGSPTISGLSDFTGVKLWQGIFSPGNVDLDSWVVAINESLGTITMSRNAIGTSSGASIAFLNGGVCHCTVGRNGVIDYQTNGDPTVRTVTINGLCGYYQGFQYNNGGKMDMQAVNFVNPGSVFAVPTTCRAGGISDNYREGIGGDYPPGLFVYLDACSFTVGDEVITLAGSAGVKAGHFINGFVTLAATLTQYSNDVQVASVAFIEGGCKVSGDGIPASSDIIGIGSTSFTMSHPAKRSGATTIKVTGAGIRNGTYIRKKVGNVITLSLPALSSQTSIQVACAGLQESGGQLV